MLIHSSYFGFPFATQLKVVLLPSITSMSDLVTAWSMSGGTSTVTHPTCTVCGYMFLRKPFVNIHHLFLHMLCIYLTHVTILVLLCHIPGIMAIRYFSQGYICCSGGYPLKLNYEHMLFVLVISVFI